MTKPNALVQVGHEHLPATVERRAPSLVEDMEVARMLAESQLLPQAYRGKVGDALVAVHIARDLGVSPYLVLTNLSFVNGKPVWAAPFLIARANASGIFAEPLSFETTGEGDKLAVTCSTVVRATGKRVSKTVSLATAKEAGWTRNALYKSIPEQLISYRAAVFLIRLHAPSILFGLHTADEMEDVAASRGQPITYEEPEPVPSPSPPRVRPQGSSAPVREAVTAVEGGGSPFVAPPPIDLPPVGATTEVGATPFTMAAPSGEDVGAVPNGASSTHAVPATPSVVASEAGPREGALGSERDDTPTLSAPSQAEAHLVGPTPAAQGADLGDEERARVLAEVKKLREEHPDLLREEAQALGLRTSPAKTPTAQLRKLVTAFLGRRPLLALTDEELHERLTAAIAEAPDRDLTITLAKGVGLPVDREGPVLGGAPRPWLERYLVKLLLTAEARRTQHAQRQDEAVRQALLTQAREVLREMSSEAAGEVFERLGILTLDDATEEQLREFIGGGA